MKLKKIFSDWVIGVSITLIFLLIISTGSFDFTHTIEMKSYDLRAKLAASEERSPDIELVVITNDDINELGRWPWSRSVIAKCIDNLHEAGAKVIALNIFFSEPEENAGLIAIRNLKKEFDELKLAQRENNGLTFFQKMTDAEKDLDNDAKLEKSIKNAGNVVFPFFFDDVSQGRDNRAPAFISKVSFKNVSNDETSDYIIEWYEKIIPPLRRFTEVAAGAGHNQLFPDRNDGHLRKQLHVLGYLDEIYVPSYAVTIVKLFKGLSDDKMILALREDSGKYINYKITPASSITVPLMEYNNGTLINWKKGPGISYHPTPFSKVLKKEIQMEIFKDKIVIIGHVAQGIADEYVTPVSGQMPGVEVLANTVDNILNQKFYYKPSWTGWFALGILLFFGIFISFVLPRLKAGMGAVTTLFLFLAYGAGGSFLFFSRNIWLEISPPLILLVVGYIVIISKRFLVTEKTKEKVEADSVETNKMLGLSFQQQGMLDLALDKFRKIPVEEEGVKELLYNLGLDFERKRQFSKALSTYSMIIGDGKDYKDLSERIPKLKSAEATTIFGGGGAGHPGDIGATLVNTDTKPTLGRYEVIDELGRGAMGVVYKGEDPKIHRTVAIKTVRLTDFDDSMIDDMKERFFREAESAGLLTHPNIVTIYDAGEEHDLAYIAMEFLQGKDLEEHTKKENLLSVRDTLSVVAQVAEALEYAHSKGIVHRDIKPANIMRIEETGEVKVTDFGIARITASSKTKTGVIMGTPSYMSPEQVSGQKVDGRSDIFSLGVVFFEMLCGEKPFKGEDMTSMMFRIAKERHPSVKAVNPKIPAVIEKIIDKALEKEVDKRYRKAGHMAEHLKIVIKKIDEAASRKKSANNPLTS
ncbi:MAG: serine/threonine-protein kinase [Desulfobacteraceae bacterium]|jgi:serine/threonine-protein kinase